MKFLKPKLVFIIKTWSKLKIINVRDLTSPTVQNRIFEDFMNKFEQLEIVDTRFQYRFTQGEKEKLGNLA